MSLKFGFKNLDIIGKEIQFKVENNEKYQTKFGGFLTLLLAVVSLISLWFFGNDIIYREKPVTTMKEFLQPQYEYRTLNNSNFFFAIRFTDFYGIFVTDPRILVPMFKYEYYEINNNTGELENLKSELMEISYCNETHAKNETLDKENLRYYYCADLNRNNYTIGGDWNSNKLGIMYYLVVKCNPEIEKEKNITCALKPELEEKYNDLFYVDVKWINHIVNPGDFNNPLIDTYDYNYYRIDMATRKEHKLFYKDSQLSTDSGVVFTDPKSTVFTQLDYHELDMGYVTENIVFDNNINFTKKITKFERVYIKIQDVAATVGGFFSITFYILRIIYYFYVEVDLQYYYYKKLLSFKLENDEFDLSNLKKPDDEEKSNVEFLPHLKSKIKKIIL
jgi:hypothetical protein